MRRPEGAFLTALSLILALLLILPAQAGEDEAAEETAAPRPARAYVLVQTAAQAGWLPLPDREEGSYTFPIVQTTADGTLVENHVRLTPEGVYMESATCENQDCVHQGMVTLENRESRALTNWILCLPNQVALALYTPEEILAMYGQ